MFYSSSYWGMNMIWWFVWFVFVFWIFATPYQIPGQRFRKETALDILQKRYASGEIKDEEYQEKRRILSLETAK